METMQTIITTSETKERLTIDPVSFTGQNPEKRTREGEYVPIALPHKIHREYAREELLKTMREMREEARENGLTDDELERILNGE
uniref:Uncharacterized protein n=1 Tax=Candidatus Kentrum sp. LPFa TaxID=2126335 RepID=A0A450WB64_9GAMM|nr:MAG: hypothetical protein BECKLPF1236A_GA0070988_101038 [Candidatus Kentron sp. LPFa]VFK30159.1 MAG: hypothetical protein BECKLPF1236C_GA0070990_101048 [Candidatus Kentron sp. LPFa]